MKARAFQLRVELKSTKKGNKSITKIVLRIKVIMKSFLTIEDSITEKDQIDLILDDLHEEYNPFVMQMYESPASPSLCDVALPLYVQEAQLVKFHQEIVMSIVDVNLTHTSQEGDSSRGAFLGSRGRGNNFTCGRGL